MLNNIAHNLAKEHWDHVHTRALLVIGDAGKGKSHLLADVCEGAINAGRPAVLILGGKLPDGEPWEEILKDLAMSEPRQPNLFLGALNAAGEAAGTRALLMIDAINERNGRAIWPERLTGLIHDVSQFEWVTLVLSCRSSYESLVVPTDLD
ncbi:ATP-binding protein, partial [Streptomyces sp. IBSBF 2953]|nr:ATP-binding protein [Streptomyces hayashii]